MIKKYKLDLEIDKIDFSKWNNLSNGTIHLINEQKKHIKSLNNMMYLTAILLFSTLFIYNFKYHEYVFFILSIVIFVITLYTITSKIKAKKSIKYLLYSKEKLKENSSKLKVRIYLSKSFDRADIFFNYTLHFICSISIMIWSLAEIFSVT
ncbi:hypothetical protein QI045_12680 [Staphylococcus saprophyticus]|nr:hypothetical protein [Staphylococcus saprophyticus]